MLKHSADFTHHSLQLLFSVPYIVLYCYQIWIEAWLSSPWACDIASYWSNTNNTGRAVGRKRGSSGRNLS